MAMKSDTKAAASKAPKAPMGAGPTTSPSMAAEDRKYRAEDDLRTMSRAEEIRRDPTRMSDMDKCRQDKMRDLASIKVEVAPRTMKKAK